MVALSSASPLVSSRELCGRCCPALFSLRVRYTLSHSHDDGVYAVLAAAGKKVLIGDGLWPEHEIDSSEILGVEGGRFKSSSSILIRTVGWEVRSFGIVLAWSWCCTGMTSTRCSTF